jgi:protein-S-isoprenylcysteine O-methyltransferase Ste14
MSLFISFFKKTVEQNQQLSGLLFLLLDWVLNVLRVSRVEHESADTTIINTHKEKLLLSTGTNIILLDYFFTLIGLITLNGSLNIKNIFSMTLKTKQLNTGGFYSFNNHFNLFSINQLYLYGIRSI